MTLAMAPVAEETAETTTAWPADRAVGARRAVAITGGALLAVAALLLFGRSPERVEAYYASGASPLAGRALSAVTGLVGVSVGELLVVASVLALAALVGRALVQVARRRRRVGNALACGLARGASGASVLAAAFYALWGLNYGRPDLAHRLCLVPFEEAAGALDGDVGELERLCAQALDATNRSYEAATGGADAGHPSAPAAPIAELDAGIDRAYERLAARLRLDPSFARSRGPAKPVLGSVALSYAGIAGMYFPFTGEANYNRDVPRYMLPEVIAHEKAHQRCVASEDEANFFSFAACIACEDAYSRYAGWLFALNQLGRELWRADRSVAERVLARRDPGVVRDLVAGDAFWDQYRGVVERVGRRVNDSYLRANGDRRGVTSYGFSTRLIVLFARANGGTLDPAKLGLGPAIEAPAARN